MKRRETWGKPFTKATVKYDVEGNQLLFPQRWRTCRICGMWVPDDVNILRDHRKKCK